MKHDYRRKQIPLNVAALCVGCKVIFDMSEGPKCPNCESTHSWMTVERAVEKEKEGTDGK